MSKTLAVVDVPPTAIPPDMVSSLILIAKSVRALNGLKLASLGFHNGQDELLMAIDESGMPTSSLAEKLCVRPSTVSKMMDRLECKGLVERSDDGRDKRRTLVRITAAGREARLRLAEARTELEADLILTMPHDTRASVTAGLAECQAHLVKRLKRLR